jgi:hypothetical protein
MLTLHEYMWAGEGPSLSENRTTIGYEVLGMPHSHRAWIANDRHRWQILRATNGVHGEWSGQYDTVSDALVTLEREDWCAV